MIFHLITRLCYYQHFTIFSVSFDESLNSVMQKEQMYVQIRYWDEKMKISKTHYLDSNDLTLDSFI